VSATGSRPPRFLQPGETLVSRFDGIGEITQALREGPTDDVTHLGHACLLVETDRVRLLIDPGTLSSASPTCATSTPSWSRHEHPDHVDDAAVRALLASNPGATLVLDELTGAASPTSTPSGRAPRRDPRPRSSGSTSSAARTPRVRRRPRCPNLAYLVGDGELLHPGDSLRARPIRCTTLAVPIDGPGSSWPRPSTT
jgi:L-ascorbate metabolism protein UlaG (beta-lactamase superfamily)